jgi:hypothetical protein
MTFDEALIAQKGIKLWLDDVRDPTHYGHIGWTWVKTVDEAIALLKTKQVAKASLDHDLTIAQTMGEDDHEPTGYDVVLFLEQNPEYLPPEGVGVHSMNPVGQIRMRKVLAKLYGYME